MGFWAYKAGFLLQEWSNSAKTARSHVALRERNSGAESGRELLKGLKDLV